MSTKVRLKLFQDHLEVPFGHPCRHRLLTFRRLLANWWPTWAPKRDLVRFYVVVVSPRWIPAAEAEPLWRQQNSACWPPGWCYSLGNTHIGTNTSSSFFLLGWLCVATCTLDASTTDAGKPKSAHKLLEKVQGLSGVITGLPQTAMVQGLAHAIDPIGKIVAR